jgi:hypothetical protein
MTNQLGQWLTVLMLCGHLQLAMNMVNVFAACQAQPLRRDQQQQLQQHGLLAADAASSSSSSSTSAGSSDWLTLQSCWLVLLGRVLLVISRAAACQVQGAVPSGLLTEQQHDESTSTLKRLLESASCISKAVQCLNQGPAAASAAAITAEAQQQLQQQAASLVSSSSQELQIGGQIPSGRSLQYMKQLSGTALQQQMQQLGEALVAQLPLPYCCNNPGCGCCEQLSEQKLVQKAGSRCSGCTTARWVA